MDVLLHNLSVCEYKNIFKKKKLYAEAGLEPMYEGWNFNSGNYLFTTDTK